MKDLDSGIFLWIGKKLGGAVFLLLILFQGSVLGEGLAFQIQVGLLKKGKFQPVRQCLSSIPFVVKIEALRGKSRDYSFHAPLEIKGLYTLGPKGYLVPLGSTGPFSNGQILLKGVYLEGPFVLYLHGSPVAQWNPEKAILPGWTSLFPPLLAIVLAFILKEVLIALFVGIWLGAAFLESYNPITGLMATLDTHIIRSFSDNPDHGQIIFFSLMLGGMVGIIVKSGFMHSLVSRGAKWVRTRRSAQLSTWGLGLLIFFDDYANTLLVGQTMRPLTDKLKVSREKLAYLVDSTAAPVASIAVISTWIGTELGYLQDYLQVRPPFLDQTPDAFQAFLMMIPYRFYSIFTLIFVFLVAWTLRDFGPMWKAEKRAWEGYISRKDALVLTDYEWSPSQQKEEEHPWYLALLPILVTILAVFGGLYYDGISNMSQIRMSEAHLWDIIGNANSLKALCWASFLGVLTAAFLAWIYNVLKVTEIVQSWILGAKSLFLALLILILAWTLGSICNELHTGEYLVEISSGWMPLWILPSVVFLLAAVIAFATGTSWGTMGLLLPLVIPMATHMLIQGGEIQNMTATSYGWAILLSSIAGVLAGASFGDHCSPISDTTVMSSMASSCDHIDHVTTQMPYALTTAAISVLCGYLPIGLGLNVWFSIVFGILTMVAVIYFLGRPLPADQEDVENLS
ncbi:MAG: Na+/H+ antiporter NhaC family protein [Planctomycetota bacterium]|nr:MAG: Na+/H+ antiporter NhaC family protein [Planctomycetota bacterium]